MNVVLEEAIMSITGRSYAKQTMTIPSVLLRLEGLTVFIGMIALYAYWGLTGGHLACVCWHRILQLLLT